MVSAFQFCTASGGATFLANLEAFLREPRAPDPAHRA
jgi:hypothetical protein